MNIEFYLIDYLKTALSSNDVYLTVPEGKPATFYVIDKLGASRENRITTSHVAIQSWADTVANACDHNETVKALMLDSLPTKTDIASVRLNSDYPYHDTSTKHPRYQAVFDIVHY